MLFLEIIGCIFGVVVISGVFSFILNKWETWPIKEEPSTPIYITKNLGDYFN